MDAELERHQETLAFLAILALGRMEVERGETEEATQFIARMRRKWGIRHEQDGST